MTTHYVLIDFENVQPKNLELLAGHPFQVYIFCGASQARVPIELASVMQQLGSKGHYVRISGNGRNALDFHIACYLGRLSREHPDDEFYRDRGQSRPRKVKTLVNTINTLFTKKLDEPELLSLIDELKRRRYLSVSEGKVSYSLPQ